jgi:hypothetical protein
MSTATSEANREAAVEQIRTLCHKHNLHALVGWKKPDGIGVRHFGGNDAVPTVAFDIAAVIGAMQGAMTADAYTLLKQIIDAIPEPQRKSARFKILAAYEQTRDHQMQNLRDGPPNGTIRTRYLGNTPPAEGGVL